jgi:hypothetical protein
MFKDADEVELILLELMLGAKALAVVAKQRHVVRVLNFMMR